jgi:hypothetical protein
MLGIAIGEGHGHDILGHPFNSVAWLATQLALRGREAENRPSRDDRKRHENHIFQWKTQLIVLTLRKSAWSTCKYDRSATQ